jgi:2-polyprenyl-3-methyl-5-hydroxy-6-metoxy-1,4-benzoquinol methylase
MSAVVETAITKEKLAEDSNLSQSADVRLRLFYSSQQVFTRARRVMEAIYAGWWLGLLDRRELNALVFRKYDEAEMYQTAAHNFCGLFPTESELVRDYFKTCQSVLVAAAGGGREVIALAQAGMRVHGFDCSLKLVEKCKEFLTQAGVSGQVSSAPQDQIPRGLERYDGAIVGYGAYAHMVGRAGRVNFLREVKECLRPGAPLLVSVGRRPQGSRYHNWIYRIARAIRLIRRSADPIEVGDDLTNCFTHRFVVSELRAELQEAGFKTLACVETHDMFAVAQA